MKKIQWADVFGVVVAVIFIGVPALFVIAPIASLVYNHYEKNCYYDQISYQTIEQKDPNRLVSDGTKVVTEGVLGKKQVCKNGNGTVLSDTTTIKPVDKVVSIPTKIAEPTISSSQLRESLFSDDQGQCPITTCNDGSCSSSTGSGTCSWHGGVAGYNY